MHGKACAHMRTLPLSRQRVQKVPFLPFHISAFLNLSTLGERVRKHRFSVDGRPNRIKKVGFSNLSGLEAFYMLIMKNDLTNLYITMSSVY